MHGEMRSSHAASGPVVDRKAAGRLRQLLAVKYRPPDLRGRQLNGTLRSSDLELPVCVVLLPADPLPRTPARDPMRSNELHDSAPNSCPSTTRVRTAMLSQALAGVRQGSYFGMQVQPADNSTPACLEPAARPLPQSVAVSRKLPPDLPWIARPFQIA